MATIQEKELSLLDEYLNYVKIHHKRPFSVYGLLKHSDKQESEFYKQFASLNRLENAIWDNWFTTTIHQIESEKVYQEYSIREKLLSFYFSWIETLKPQRDFVTTIIKNSHTYWATDRAFRAMKASFKDYAKSLVEEGKLTGELPDRLVINELYYEPLWYQLLFVMHFWCHDKSEAFGDTDAAIEKAVNLSFDVIGHNALDSAFDFVKFWYQRK